MDRRERLNELPTSIMAAFDGLIAGIWTALPGIIKEFDPTKMTAVVQPALQVQIQSPTGAWSWISLPAIYDCPVIFPSGGGVMLTFPIKNGDECLLIFASRCIDAWWQSGGVQLQAELRFHDLSDGFCLPGPRSVPNVPGGISVTNTELRSTDGATKISLNPAGSVVDVTAARINLNGELWINGSKYALHKHSGVQSGGSQTGGVV